MYSDFLQELIIAGDVSNVERTLNSGYNINQTDSYGMTYLQCAIFRGLLKQGLDIPKDVAKAQQKIIKLLLQNGANVNDFDLYHDRTSLHGAASFGQIDIAYELIKNGGDVNSKNKNGKTPLYNATLRKDNINTIKELLAMGADITITDNDGNSVLDIAKRYNYNEYLEYYTDISNLINKVKLNDKQGVLTLLNSVTNRDFDIFQRLALKTSLQENNIDLANAILENININQKGTDGYTLLHFAVISDNEKLVRLLLRKKAKMSVLDKEKNTPIHLAVLCGHFKMFSILANRTTTDVLFLENQDGYTAKQIALHKNDLCFARHISELENDTIVRDVISYSTNKKINSVGVVPHF